MKNLCLSQKLPTKILPINNFNLQKTNRLLNMKLMCGKLSSPSSTKPLAILHRGVWHGCFEMPNFHFGK